MKSTITIAIVAFTIASPSVLQAEPVKNADKNDEKREKIDTAIVEAIRLLEAKDYKAVLEKFAMPETLKKMTENSEIEDVAKDFGEKKADRLLKVLKAVKDAKPTMSDEGKKATFDLKEEIAGKKTISFVKIDKYWYIGDK